MMSDNGTSWRGLTVSPERHNGLRLRQLQERKKRRVKDLSMRVVADNIFEDAKVESLTDAELAARIKKEGLEEYMEVTAK